MSKVIKSGERKDFFAQGGNTKMFGKGHASPKDADSSGKEGQGEQSGIKPERPFEHESYTNDVRYLGGGNHSMFGKGHAGKKVPGISGKADQSG